MTEHNMTNSGLFACSWVSSIIISLTMDLSPILEFVIKAAPWGSTAILYLINYDKINTSISKIIKKFKIK